MTEIYATIIGFTLIYFTLLFLLGCIIKNYAIADIGWGWGFVIITIICANRPFDHSSLFWITTFLVSLWGCRLSTHIYFRNAGKPEDFRYRQMRESWIKFPYLQAYLKLFISQAIIMTIVSTCIILSSQTTEPPATASWIFLYTALFGFVYESISDYQLMRFKKMPKNQGRIMTDGLWRYSRHPNYFGEIVFWWSLSLFIAISTRDYFALISGATMNALILFVSGIPMLEKKYAKNPEYAEYINTTNSLLPKWPK